MTPLLEEPPEAFAGALLGRGRRRACFVRDPGSGRLEPSEPWLAEAAEALRALADWRDHEALFLEVGPRSGCLFAAALHSTVRGQALGGVRHAPYARTLDVLRDALRLSLGMTRKSALAGLWWGGGKGVIAQACGRDADEPAFRRTLYREWGAFVSGLRGCYVTAEDAGTTPADMGHVFEATRHATCVPPDVGGSGNPSLHTALGVVCAMEAALDALGRGTLAGKRIALQGAGQVGAALAELLLEKGVARLCVAETSAECRQALEDRLGCERLQVVAARPGEPGILAEPCDVLVPAALGGVLGPKTIPHVQAPLVCGPANNQLEDEARDGRALHARGSVLVPEIIANRMGVVHCANEQYGSLPRDPAVERHLRPDWEHAIGPTTRRVLARAAELGIPPVEAANRLADALAATPHPLWPGRGRALVAALVAERWHAAGALEADQAAGLRPMQTTETPSGRSARASHHASRR